LREWMVIREDPTWSKRKLHPSSIYDWNRGFPPVLLPILKDPFLFPQRGVERFH
jgi:hypothetical protein